MKSDPEALLRHALYYASQGWHIFPLAPYSKKPWSGSHGLNDATTDTEQVRSWWAAEPHANIGVNCGKSGLVVLDVDTKDGKVGSQSLYDIIGDDFSMLATVRADTWSGGYHYFFKGSCASSASELARDLDIKGDGGYIVLAPSVVQEGERSGKYSWRLDLDGEKQELQDFPALFRPVEKKREPMVLQDDTKLSEGQRDATIYRLGCQMRRYGWSEEEIYAALAVVNRRRCEPMLPDKTIREKAKRAAIHQPTERVRDTETTPTRSYGFKGADKIIERSSELQDWLVENLLGPNGLCLFSAQPGAGKSTLMRTLASAVAEGSVFLSRQCKKGLVAWVGMEESDRDLASAIEDLDLIGNDNILYAGQSDLPATVDERWKMLESFIAESRPSLVIIDTLAKFAELGDINHYTEVGKGLGPFLRLRDQYKVAFVLIHHTNAAGTALGSTRLKADVDVLLDMTIGEGGARIISTSKVRGNAIAIEPTLLTFDPASKMISSEEPKWLVDKRICEQNILRYLATVETASRQSLADRAGRGGSIARTAVDALLSAGLVSVTGSGKKGDPKLYALAKPASLQGFSILDSSDDQRPNIVRPKSDPVRPSPTNSEESEFSEESEPCTSGDAASRASHLRLVESGESVMDYAVRKLGAA